MAEAEEVLQDVAKHATVFVRDLWLRHRKDSGGEATLALTEVAARLDLLMTGAFGRAFALKVAEPPAPPTFLTKVFRHREGPQVVHALASTDGTSIWLPARMPEQDGMSGLSLYRIMALRQATRAVRGSAAVWHSLRSPWEQAFFTVYEAHAADVQLLQALPGTLQALKGLQRMACRARPAPHTFPPHRQPLEGLLRRLLESDLTKAKPMDTDAVLALARAEAKKTATSGAQARAKRILFRDLWTGEFRSPSPIAVSALPGALGADEGEPAAKSARLARSPRVREAQSDEDEDRQGAWMVQTSQPQEQAEDPMGMQRPTDRDASTAAEELADSLSELPEARLVSSPGKPKEILLSADALESHGAKFAAARARDDAAFCYPEWDCRTQRYEADAVTVHVRATEEGRQAWVDETLNAHQAMLGTVRRHFDMLKSQRVRLNKQLDGEEVDLNAYTEGYADYRAGLPLPQALYSSCRQTRRDTAVLILTDISGSTDGWVSANRRVIDVEREALLLVATALDSMRAPAALQAFSGEGPRGVIVRSIKAFTEPFSPEVARRIASLEPEHYTRAGAALRHATASMMREHARHRLLLLLSDGKPNDLDHYEGQYGVEDMRQAVTEAKLQGIHPFCLTVDRQGAAYLPRVFGPGQYGILPRPERLPAVLLEWMKRLIRS